jgi:hypothetical protein
MSVARGHPCAQRGRRLSSLPDSRAPPQRGSLALVGGQNEAGPTCSDIGPADHGSNPWVSLIVMH